MIIEQTHAFVEKEDAEDCLEGMKRLPGFIIGYIRLPRTASHRHEAVGLFECADGAGKAGQRTVENLTLEASK